MPLDAIRLRWFQPKNVAGGPVDCAHAVPVASVTSTRWLRSESGTKISLNTGPLVRPTTFEMFDVPKEFLSVGR